MSTKDPRIHFQSSHGVVNASFIVHWREGKESNREKKKKRRREEKKEKRRGEGRGGERRGETWVELNFVYGEMAKSPCFSDDSEFSYAVSLSIFITVPLKAKIYFLMNCKM